MCINQSSTQCVCVFVPVCINQSSTQCVCVCLCLCVSISLVLIISCACVQFPGSDVLHCQADKDWKLEFISVSINIHLYQTYHGSMLQHTHTCAVCLNIASILLSVPYYPLPPGGHGQPDTAGAHCTRGYETVSWRYQLGWLP